MKISTVNEKYKITYKAYYKNGSEISTGSALDYVEFISNGFTLVDIDLSDLIPNEVIDCAYFTLPLANINDNTWSSLCYYIENSPKLPNNKRFELCFNLYESSEHNIDDVIKKVGDVYYDVDYLEDFYYVTNSSFTIIKENGEYDIYSRNCCFDITRLVKDYQKRNLKHLIIAIKLVLPLDYGSFRRYSIWDLNKIDDVFSATDDKPEIVSIYFHHEENLKSDLIDIYNENEIGNLEIDLNKKEYTYKYSLYQLRNKILPYELNIAYNNHTTQNIGYGFKGNWENELIFCDISNTFTIINHLGKYRRFYLLENNEYYTCLSDESELRKLTDENGMIIIEITSKLGQKIEYHVLNNKLDNRVIYKIYISKITNKHGDKITFLWDNNILINIKSENKINDSFETIDNIVFTYSNNNLTVIDCLTDYIQIQLIYSTNNNNNNYYLNYIRKFNYYDLIKENGSYNEQYSDYFEYIIIDYDLNTNNIMKIKNNIIRKGVELLFDNDYPTKIVLNTYIDKINIYNINKKEYIIYDYLYDNPHIEINDQYGNIHNIYFNHNGNITSVKSNKKSGRTILGYQLLDNKFVQRNVEIKINDHINNYNLIPNGNFTLLDNNGKLIDWNVENWANIIEVNQNGSFDNTIGNNEIIFKGFYEYMYYNTNPYLNTFDIGAPQVIYQTINKSSYGNDEFILTAIGKINNDLLDNIKIIVEFKYNDIIVENKTIKFTNFDDDVQGIMDYICVNKPYTQIKVSISYYGLSDVAFKYICLHQVENGTYSYYKDNNIYNFSYGTNNNATQIYFDEKNNSMNVVDNNGHIQYSIYNNRGLIERKEDGNSNNNILYEYDNFGNVTKIETLVDNKKVVEVKNYQNNLLISEISDDGYTVNYTYNPKNQLTQIQDYLDFKTKYSYTNHQYLFDILKEDENNLSEFFKFEYDRNYNIESIIMIDYKRYSYDYNDYGQLTNVKLLNNNIVSFEYNSPNGYQNQFINKKKYGIGDDNYYQFEYNAHQQIDLIKYLNSVQYRFIYDDRYYDRLKEVQYVNSNNETYKKIKYEYEVDNNRINKVIELDENDEEVLSGSYVYDSDNNIQQETQKIGEDYKIYNYDYRYETSEYNLKSFLGMMSKINHNDTLIPSKNNKLLYGEEPILNSTNLHYIEKIDSNVLEFSHDNANITYLKKDINKNRISGIYYNNKIFEKNMFEDELCGTISSYVWINFNNNTDCSFPIFNFCSNSSIYCQLIKGNNNYLKLRLNDEVIDTPINIEVNKWNLIGITISLENIKVYCNDVCYSFVSSNSGLKKEEDVSYNQRQMINVSLIESVSIGKYYELNTQQSSLVIGNSYVKPIYVLLVSMGHKNYEFDQFASIFYSGRKYLNDYKVTLNSGVTYYDFDYYNTFDVITLNGCLISKKGKKPEYLCEMNTLYGTTKASAFEYDQVSNMHVYASYRYNNNQIQGHNSVLAYKLGIKNKGIITLWVKPDSHCYNDDIRYIIDFKSTENNYLNEFALCLDSLNNLRFVQMNSINLYRKLIPDEWNLLVIKIENDKLSFKVNDSNYVVQNVGQINLENSVTYVGCSSRQFNNEYYQLNGHLKMLCYTNSINSSYTNEFFNNMYNNSKLINVRKFYDDYNRVTSKSITVGNQKLTNKYLYFEEQDKLINYCSSEMLYNNEQIIYNYNEDGFVTHKILLDTNKQYKESFVYEYDGFKRLIKEIKYGQNNVFEYAYIYEYDNFGNIIFKNKIDNNDDVIECISYEYDANNVWLLKNVLYNSNNLYNITYDQNNPLYPTSISKNNTVANLCWEGKRLKSYGNVNFIYDHTGNRTKKYCSDYSVDYIFQNNRIIRSIFTRTNNNIIIDYQYDENNQLIGLEYNNKFYFYERDILGNINKIVDEQGNVYVEYSYTAYGVPTSIINNNFSNIALILKEYNVFLYKGYVYDVETQLYWVSSRYYSPELCRWISPDSIEYLDPQSINGLNLYAYCGNDPINKYDPTGHFGIWALVAITAASMLIGGTAQLVSNAMAGKTGSELWRGVAGAAVGAGVNALALCLAIPTGGASLFIAAGASAIAQTGVDTLETVIRGEEVDVGQTFIDLGLNFVTTLAGNYLGGKMIPTNPGWFQPQKFWSVFTKPYGQKILLQTAIGAGLSGTVNFIRKNDWSKYKPIIPVPVVPLYPLF